MKSIGPRDACHAINLTQPDLVSIRRSTPRCTIFFTLRCVASIVSIMGIINRHSQAKDVSVQLRAKRAILCHIFIFWEGLAPFMGSIKLWKSCEQTILPDIRKCLWLKNYICFLNLGKKHPLIKTLRMRASYLLECVQHTFRNACIIPLGVCASYLSELVHFFPFECVRTSFPFEYVRYVRSLNHFLFAFVQEIKI